MTGVHSAWLTKAQSHSGLVRNSKFLEIVLGKQCLVGNQVEICGAVLKTVNDPVVFLHEHLFVDLFGRQAAWRPGDAEQALCIDSDEAGSTYSARGPHAHYFWSKTCHKLSFFVSCRDTLGKTQFCGSLLAAPLLTDVRRSTVGSGTREDIVTNPDEMRYMTRFMRDIGGPDLYVAIQTQIMCGVPTRRYFIVRDFVMKWDDMVHTRHRNFFYVLVVEPEPQCVATSSVA